MKNLRLLKRLLFTIVALSLSTTASFAHDFEVDWIYYNILSESDKTVEVTCRGEWYDSYTNEYSGSVTIPETVTYSGKTYSVTSIGDDAFCGCSGLTSVTIPNSVTSIGEYAFDYCTGLTSVTIPNSVTAIGYGAFEDCSGLKSVTIGNSVTSIGNYAFDGCSGLTSVTIPNSVTSIGKYAFLGCSGLTSIRVESGNSNYDSRDNCNAIIETETNTLIVGCQNTMIPNSVTSIGDDAFSRCYDLTSVTIPNSVTSIGKYAFAYCSGLTSVTIGNSVTSIGVGAFYGCNDLTSVTIPNSVTSIGDEAFSRCNDLTSVTIPNSVTSIGDDAFRGCSGLTEVTIGNSVTSIGEYAFYECSGLTEVTIGNSVTEIGRYAFYGCKNLNQVINLSKLSLTKGSDNHGYVAYYASIIINVPNGIINGDFVWSISEEDDVNILVRYLGAASELILPDDYNGENYVIGNDAFYNCKNLRSVTIGNSVTSIGNSAFYNCSGLTSVTIPNSVTSIGNSAFSGCSSLTSVTIPNSVTSIENYAFYGCSGLTSINVESGNSKYDSRDNCNAIIETGTNTLIVGCQNTMIPNSVTKIGNDAFRGCTGLKSVTIPNSVTSIGSSAFKDCSGLTEVTIPNSVTSIGSSTFEGCSALTSVTIPNSVTSIGSNAFEGCSGLTEVNYNAENCTLMGSYYYPVFEDCTNLKTVNIGNSVNSIPGDAFKDCSGLTSVTIGNSVTSIGSSAFYNCTKLNRVINLSKLSLTKGSTNHGYVAYYASIIINVPNGIINGDFVWSISEEDDVNILVRYLGAASELILPDDYNGENYVIGNDAFYNCKNLRSVTIGNSVTSIGDSAFENCKNLRSVTIGNSVTSIGDSAFYNCSGLTEVTIGNSVTSIGDWAFSGCKKITKLVIADGTETLPLGNSFTDCPFVKLYLGRDYSYNTTDSPFSNKKTLKEITIGNSITSIREKEFLNCIGLTSLTIGTGVLSIGTNAFSYYDNNNYSNLDIKKVIWLTNTPPQGYETVAGEVNYVANNRYSDLSNVTIYPYLSSLFEVDGIKYVPVSPSERTCDALECSYETTISNINIGKTVSFKGIEMNIKAVKPYTFYDNTNITKATIDSEFKGSIGDYAFAYCNKIDEIILPDGVTSLGGSAFEGCSSLASVEIGSGIPALNDNAFYGCTPLSKITIPANVTSIGNNVFGNCSSLEELTITDRDTELSLGSNGSNPLFSDCPLKSVYIGGNISYPTSSDYGYSPFYRNISLETVVITDKETEISENEFYGCTALKTVYMGDGVKTIGDWAFSGCSSLDSFSFGTGMKTIGTEAFSDCTAMTKLYSNAIVPPTCGSQALDDINKWNCELYVPQASITKYQIADQWKEFFFIKDIESGIEDVYVEEVAVTVEDGKIVVKNVTGIVTIYNLNGIAVASETADGNEVRFDNLQPGVYIVVVNNKSVKVVL